MNIESVAEAHARELNKSINQVGKEIGLSILIGLGIIALAIRTKKWVTKLGNSL